MVEHKITHKTAATCMMVTRTS